MVDTHPNHTKLLRLLEKLGINTAGSLLQQIYFQDAIQSIASCFGTPDQIIMSPSAFTDLSKLLNPQEDK